MEIQSITFRSFELRIFFKSSFGTVIGTPSIYPVLTVKSSLTSGFLYKHPGHLHPGVK